MKLKTSSFTLACLRIDPADWRTKILVRRKKGRGDSRQALPHLQGDAGGGLDDLLRRVGVEEEFPQAKITADNPSAIRVIALLPLRDAEEWTSDGAFTWSRLWDLEDFDDVDGIADEMYEWMLEDPLWPLMCLLGGEFTIPELRLAYRSVTCEEIDEATLRYRALRPDRVTVTGIKRPVRGLDALRGRKSEGRRWARRALVYFFEDKEPLRLTLKARRLRPTHRALAQYGPTWDERANPVPPPHEQLRSVLNHLGGKGVKMTRLNDEWA